MKAGDRVRYLNAIGGGIVTRIEGNMAYVDEDGFETPVLTKELVVVLPAGHQPASGARLMFDQSAYDAGKGKTKINKEVKETESAHSTVKVKDESTLLTPRRTAPVGDISGNVKLRLIFEPTNIKSLDNSRFVALLVNDSPYDLTFCLSSRGADKHSWQKIFSDTVAPEEIIELAELGHTDLPDFEYILLQGFFCSEDARFEKRAPLDISRRFDTTKFHKLHCFRQGQYSDIPVLEVALEAERPEVTKSHLKALEESFGGNIGKTASKNKGGVDRKKVNHREDPVANPHKLLPPVEVDLHIEALTDTIRGMEPKDMLAMQLEEVRKVMDVHRRRKGQKIIFIHGKGEGVLRNEVLKFLRKAYPAAELQDASFREYGFGATLVTVH